MNKIQKALLRFGLVDWYDCGNGFIDADYRLAKDYCIISNKFEETIPEDNLESLMGKFVYIENRHFNFHGPARRSFVTVLVPSTYSEVGVVSGFSTLRGLRALIIKPSPAWVAAMTVDL
jgi:hypothetical protein